MGNIELKKHVYLYLINAALALEVILSDCLEIRGSQKTVTLAVRTLRRKLAPPLVALLNSEPVMQ